MTERTNQEWLDHLQAAGITRANALNDLREHLRRGLYFYLSRDRTDLRDRTTEDLQHMAEDFAQDALLKVLDNLDTFRGESRFTTWAAKIAVRVAISELRRLRWKDYSLDKLTAEGEFMPRLSPTTPLSPDGPPGPETFTEQSDVRRIIEQAIAEALTERQRTAIVGAALEGVPLAELARMMDTNTNALYKLIHDARLKLRSYLEEHGITLDYVMDLFDGA